MAMDQETRRRLEDMFNIIEKRKKTFGKVLLGLAFSRNEKSELRVCFGLVKFLGKGEAPPKEATYDYGNFILTKKPVEVSKGLKLISSIFENGVLKFSGWPEVPLKLRLSQMYFIESRSRYGYISSTWPMMYAYSEIDGSVQGKIPHDSLSRTKLPLFPDGNEAINIFFELNLPEDWHTPYKRIEFFMPDYRAMIKNLRLAGNKITIDVETKEIVETDLLAKFYCRTKGKSYTSADLPLEQGHATYFMDNEPIQVEAHILSAIEGESIDRKKFDYRYPSRQEGVMIENVEGHLLNVINKGENVNVEFKRAFDKERARIRFLRTVVAFANTKGGTIFIGVDDDCRIIGFREDAKARTEDLIADNCDPPIEVQIDSELIVQGKPITLVKVPEGKNKPYTLKDRGIFVRRGSSNRQMKRTELDDIYAERQSSSPYYR